MKGAGEGVMSPVGEAVGVPVDGWDAAFDAAYLKHQPRVAAVLRRVTGDRARTEELLNDVFTGLHRDRARLLALPESEVASWLYRRAVHLGIDALRVASRRQKYEGSAAGQLEEVDPSTDPLERVLRDAERARVRAVLAAMKPAQAQLLLLRSSGCSYGELAAALDVEPGAVGTMLVRAQAAFRKVYSTQHPQESP
jgi:RNA polymerase sigma-70 factor (ECF subfamily)